MLRTRCDELDRDGKGLDILSKGREEGAFENGRGRNVELSGTGLEVGLRRGQGTLGRFLASS